MNLLIIDESLHCATTGTIMCILQFINKYRKQNNILLENISNIYIYKNKGAPFNLIFDDNYNVDNVTTLLFSETTEIEPMNYNYIYSNIEYQLLSKKIRFSKNITDLINNEITNIDDNTLGIHFRFTDMNQVHSISNPTNYNKYFVEIINYIKKYNITTIFVASDNNESINKITNESELKHIKFIYRDVKRYYKEDAEPEDMVWYSNPDKSSPHPHMNNFKYKIFNINDPNIHVECIIDCILLSKCKHLIFPYSNVSNLSILLSDTIINKSKL
jgi:hypothetical protein